MTERPALTVAIVGAGPMGLQLACLLARRGVGHVVLERGNVGASIEGFPPGMRFLPSNPGLEIDDVPLESAGARATREEYLAYLREVVRVRNLDVRTGHEVVDVQPEPDAGFRLRVRQPDGELELRADRVVLALGEFARPTRLGVPGEDLPHVSHYFRGTEGLAGKRVLIVGGGNSATEAAVALVEAGGQVLLCLRRDRFGPGAEATRRTSRRVQALAAAGHLDLRFWTQVTRIEQTCVHLSNATGADEVVPADCVLLLTGYEPDLSLVAQAGGSRVDAVPDAMTLETQVPGLYLAGTAATRSRGGRSFIKHTRKHAVRIVAHIHGEAVPKRYQPPPPRGTQRRRAHWMRRLENRRRRWAKSLRRRVRRAFRDLRTRVRGPAAPPR